MIDDISDNSILSKRNISLAVIGGGEGASKALNGLKGFPPINLKYVQCEKNELIDLIDDNLRVCDYSILLNQDDVQAFYIATPNSTHLPLAKEAILSKKYVLIEKPLASSYNDARDFLNLESVSEYAFVAFKKRFGLSINHLLKIKKIFGEPISCIVKWYTHKPTSTWYYDSNISGGGVTVDLGSHIFDILEYVISPIKNIRTDMKMSNLHNGIDISSSFQIEFINGCKGQVHLSWEDEPLEQSLYILFERGEIKICKYNSEFEQFTYKQGNNSDQLLFSLKREYQSLFQELCKKIWRQDSKIPTINEGMRNLKIIDIAYRSFLTGQAEYLFD